MRERKPLQVNTELRFTNYFGGEVSYFVDGLYGAGGTCMVYKGHYISNSNDKKTVIIKECLPYKLHLERDEDGSVIVNENELSKYREYLQRFKTSYLVSSDLWLEGGLTNTISNTYDIYAGNNTLYIVSSYMEGDTLDNCTLHSLQDAVKIVLSVAKSIEKIHNKGFLYLDIKPDNIFVLPETADIVQLFDFDSIIPMNIGNEINDYRLSYSMGFAPYEQKSGKMAGIGKYSDVYSIGALLFYILFGKTPKAYDCGNEAVYDFEQIKFKDSYQDKLFFEIDNFFRNTLQSYYADRYQEMRAAITQLEKIVKLADTSAGYIVSTPVTGIDNLIGRSEELSALDGWLNSKKSVLFVSGMGGIGKSTLVRNFLQDKKDNYETVVYTYFNESIIRTISDDNQVIVNNCEKISGETLDEYFVRKSKAIKKAAAQEKIVLVIDNFEFNENDSFADILSLGCKTILITRTDVSDFEYPYIYVDSIKNNNDLYELFSGKLMQEISVEDKYFINKLINMTCGNTLLLELIAKQISKSYLSIPEVLNLAEDNGISGIAPEKVNYFRDGDKINAQISKILKAVYDTGKMDETQRHLLKIISLFNAPGIDAKEIKKYAEIANFDVMNELVEDGWITVQDRKVFLHPLIQETIHDNEWSMKDRETAQTIMCDLTQKTKQYKKDGEFSELLKTLEVSRSFLKNVAKDNELKEKSAYEELLFVSVINMPREEEDFIIKGAQFLFENEYNTDPYKIIELYDYVAFIYCQKAEYSLADELLDKALAFAENQSDDYVWGIYYDMKTTYYDNILEGDYSGLNKYSPEVIAMMFEASGEAMSHMSESNHPKSKSLLAKYVLGCANLTIRCFPEQSEQAREILINVQSLIEECTSEYSEERSAYYMSWAWYYTLSKPDYAMIEENLEYAGEIERKFRTSDIDYIENYIEPAAYMMWEHEELEESVEWLEAGIIICERHKDSIPFIRKKTELMSHILDVYYNGGYYDECSRIIERIDAANEENAGIGIFYEVPPEIR